MTHIEFCHARSPRHLILGAKLVCYFIQHNQATFALQQTAVSIAIYLQELLGSEDLEDLQVTMVQVLHMPKKEIFNKEGVIPYFIKYDFSNANSKC